MDGAAERRVPWLVIHVPHASTFIPPDLRGSLALTGAELEDELLRMTDRYTDELFRLPDAVAQHVVFGASRLVVDPERFPEDAQEPMAERGMGAVYTRTSRGSLLRPVLSREEREQLLARFYLPHHRELEQRVADALSEHGRCLILDGHSFSSLPLPHERDQAPDRPQICVGTDPFHTPQWLLQHAASLFTEAGFSLAVNRPFAGALVPLRFYRSEPRVLAVMVEVNRRLYMDERSGERHGDFAALQAQLQEILTRFERSASRVTAGA